MIPLPEFPAEGTVTDPTEDLAVACVELRGALERLELVLQYRSRDNYLRASDAVNLAMRKYMNLVSKWGYKPGF